jgi:hypothetical protein
MPAMDRHRGIVASAGRGHRAVRRCRGVGPGRARRLVGWLAAVSLLLHGSLPIVLQVHLAGPAAGGHAEHGHAASAAAPPSVPSNEGPECPLFHSAICLCAAFVKLLPAPAASALGPAFAARRRRSRFPAQRPWRRRPALLFDARAPPGFG